MAKINIFAEKTMEGEVPAISIDLTKLNDVFKIDHERECNVKKDNGFDSDQQYTFRGILGEIQKVKVQNSHMYRFNLYYASLDDDSYDKKIIFRCLKCLFHESLYSLLRDLTHDSNGQIGFNEVIVTGIFEKGDVITFKLYDIDIDSNPSAIFRYEKGYDYSVFNYDKIPKVTKYLDDVINGRIDITLNDINHGALGRVLKSSNQFQDFIKELKSDKITIKSYNLLKKKLSYINDTFNHMALHHRPSSGKIDKLRLILDDIIMMHSGLQTENHDQLNVLYDANCIEAMSKIMFILKCLTVIDNSVITIREAVLMMLVYIKGFYARYIDKSKLDLDTVRSYGCYDNTTTLMITDMYFKRVKINSLYLQMEYFIDILTKHYFKF